MRTPLDELNYLITSSRRTTGIVVSVQGTEFVIATPQGAKMLSSSVAAAVDDRVILNDGVIVSVLSRPESLSEFTV
jgi:hypothetical protein